MKRLGTTYGAGWAMDAELQTDGLLRQLYVDCEWEANAVSGRRRRQLTKRARLPALRCIARGNVMQLISAWLN